MNGKIATSRSGLLLVSAALSSGCLEPLVDDAIDPRRVFGDPELELAQIPHVEEDPAHAARAEHFATETAYLRGYAGGRRIWYWNVPGPNVDFIVPMYILVDRAGNETGRWIFDALPGDGGYSPWWRKFTVRVTERYEGQKIWSREAIDLGVELGLLEPPEPTPYVYDYPIVSRYTRTAVDDGVFVGTSTAWYRNQRVSFIDFEEATWVSQGVTTFPKFPVYLLQRINEPAPIYEYATGVDLNGDGRLIDSNNIFAGGLDEERYSPLWYVASARVPATYRSIETGVDVDFARESDLYQDAERRQPAAGVSIQLDRERLVNCPIQREKGSL